MYKEFEKRINDESSEKIITLTEDLNICLDKKDSFSVGRFCIKELIGITRSEIVVDGLGKHINVEIRNCTSSDFCLFYIHPSARDILLCNLTIKIRIKNPEDTSRLFAAIYNTAYGVKMQNCRIEIVSDKHINLYAIYNNGNLDTHMETRADNLVIDNCLIKVDSRSENPEKDCRVYGLYNNMANSLSLQNTFIYSTVNGNSEKQKAVGVYTSGRFGRFIGNNIKANGCHNKGRQKEHPTAIGFLNEGQYSLITSNNIVGEWAGIAIGLESRGEFASVASNKILATHTICGRSIRNFAQKSTFTNNIITSTSRNARLFELNASNCVISHNIMQVLMAFDACRSGCAVYVAENSVGNIITENVIKNVLDCGFFAESDVGVIVNNRLDSYLETVEMGDRTNTTLFNKLDEKNIISLPIE